MSRLIVILAGFLLLSSSNSWYRSSNPIGYEQIQTLDFVRASQGETALLNQIVERASEQDDIYWLQQAAQLGHEEALYRLALLAKDDTQRLKWLALAADAGIAAAQFELSLLSNHQQQRSDLLQASAEQGYPAAQHALANWFLLNQNQIAAIEWLGKSAAHYPQDAFSLANIYWLDKQYQQAIYWYQVAAKSNHQEAQQFLNVAVNEKALSLAEANQQTALFDDLKTNGSVTCAKHILPVSLSLTNQVQAIEIVETFNTDSRFNNIPICFSKPMWLENTKALCEQQVLAGRRRTVCDVTQLETLIRNNNITHIIVLLPEGRAYVNAGLMYLSVAASYSLFVHELAHFAGFADEYPINDELAKIHCAEQTAPNLLFDGELTYAPSDRLINWQALVDTGEDSSELSIHVARTCNNAGQNAYKITDQRTFMEFHDTGNIPMAYQVMWRQQVINKPHWYPVAINLARHYELQNEYAAEAHWRAFAELQRGLGAEAKVSAP